MKRAIFGITFTVAAVVAPLSAKAVAPTVNVGNFGDQGWRSDDTRDFAGNNLVGTNYTNAGKPGQTPTAADDAAIAQQIQFVTGPAGSTYGGAVSIDGTSGNSGKSNISTINPFGFDQAANLLTTFNATYAWYDQPNPTSRTLGFKLGIQSTNYGPGAGQSQNGFTAQRSGESVWDLVLVYLGNSSDNVWTTESVDHDSGNWLVFRQAGNAYYPAPPAGAMTLDAWAADPTWGPVLFGPGAKVSSVQFGLGSSQRQSIAYVDYLQTNLLSGGAVVNFVPEPGTFGVLALAGLLGAARRRRHA